MPSKKSKRRIPKYRHYKPKDLAVVRSNGQDHYLGKYGSRKSKEKYAQLIAEHFSSDGFAVTTKPSEGTLSVNELILKYWTEYVPANYVRDGKPTDRYYHVRLALKALKEAYGSLPADQFGPKKLQVVRERMIQTREEEGKKPQQKRKSRQLRDHYCDETYCQAVTRACDRLKIPRWTPGQLRHNVATALQNKYGIEMARLILGHRHASTTAFTALRLQLGYPWKGYPWKGSFSGNAEGGQCPHAVLFGH